MTDIAFPLRLAGDQLVFLETASPAETVQRVELLCVTPPGWLDGRPDLGLSDQTHRKGGPDTAEIERQLATHIPESDALVDTDLSRLNEALARVGVQVTA